jgi:hypothetical protein
MMVPPFRSCVPTNNEIAFLFFSLRVSFFLFPSAELSSAKGGGSPTMGGKAPGVEVGQGGTSKGTNHPLHFVFGS